jgi:hypothetical protein
MTSGITIGVGVELVLHVNKMDAALRLSNGLSSLLEMRSAGLVRLNQVLEVDLTS